MIVRPRIHPLRHQVEKPLRRLAEHRAGQRALSMPPVCERIANGLLKELRSNDLLVPWKVSSQVGPSMTATLCEGGALLHLHLRTSRIMGREFVLNENPYQQQAIRLAMLPRLEEVATLALEQAQRALSPQFIREGVSAERLVTHVECVPCFRLRVAGDRVCDTMLAGIYVSSTTPDTAGVERIRESLARFGLALVPQGILYQLEFEIDRVLKAFPGNPVCEIEHFVTESADQGPSHGVLFRLNCAGLPNQWRPDLSVTDRVRAFLSHCLQEGIANVSEAGASQGVPGFPAFASMRFAALDETETSPIPRHAQLAVGVIFHKRPIFERETTELIRRLALRVAAWRGEQKKS